MCSELDGTKGQGTARWGYPLPGSRRRRETETTANPCQGNSCRILPRGSGSEVGQDFGRQRQPLRQALPLYQMGASLPAQAWGFPQSCWDPPGLGESCHLLHVRAASWLRLGCWAFLSHVLSL